VWEGFGGEWLLFCGGNNNLSEAAVSKKFVFDEEGSQPEKLPIKNSQPNDANTSYSKVNSMAKVV
jgi:hypothetical protein